MSTFEGTKNWGLLKCPLFGNLHLQCRLAVNYFDSNQKWRIVIQTLLNFSSSRYRKDYKQDQEREQKTSLFQVRVVQRNVHTVEKRYQLHCENAYVTLSCTGYSKEKPLWKPGISHFSGYLMSYNPQITSDYKREAKNKEARQRIRGERKGIFGGYFHLYCKTLYNYSDTFQVSVFKLLKLLKHRETGFVNCVV